MKSQNPALALASLRGLVVLDEVQRMPALFETLRVPVDRPGPGARYLILGSASPSLVRGVSESLAGRVEFLELGGFDLGETGAGKTVRSYLDILTGTFLVRQLQPWHTNIGRRQVKAPKIYLRDSGVLHRLLGIDDHHDLLGHPQAGASWEGFALEQTLAALHQGEACFRSAHSGPELDLSFVRGGQRFGIEFNLTDAPRVTRSMRTALEDLDLRHLWVVHAGRNRFPMDEKITAWPLRGIPALGAQVEAAGRRRARR